MIEWTDQAIRQLDQAYDCITLSNSPEVATRITEKIISTIQQLTAFPNVRQNGPCRGHARTGDIKYTIYCCLCPLTATGW